MANVQKKQNFFQRNAMFIVIYVFLFLFSAFMIFMLAWGLLTTFKSANDFDINKNVIGFPTLDPSNEYNSIAAFFRFENYGNVIMNFTLDEITMPFYRGGELIMHQSGEVNFFTMLLNSILYSGGGALILAIMPAIVAYLCAKYPYKFSKVVFITFTVIMCVPIVGNFPSEVTFLRNAGLYDQIWGNFIQKLGGAGMYFFVYYAFFKGLSNTYREAAEIDGASELKIMVRVYFPLALKIIATVFLIQFVALWNDFSTPLLYLPTHPTLAFGIYKKTAVTQVKDILFQGVPTKITACMLLAIPIVVIFIIFKNKLMGNISLGGIKE